MKGKKSQSNLAELAKNLKSPTELAKNLKSPAELAKNLKTAELAKNLKTAELAKNLKTAELAMIALLVSLVVLLIPKALMAACTSVNPHRCDQYGFFLGTAQIDQMAIQVGDKVKALVDSVSVNEGCVGIFVVDTIGNYGAISIYEDDLTTMEKDGVTQNELIHFKICHDGVEYNCRETITWNSAYLNEINLLNLTTCQSPVATFNPSVVSGCAPLAINFSNTSTEATSYSWDFGEHTPIVTEDSPSYTFISPGVYKVTLTAENACGKVTKSQTIKVMACHTLTLQVRDEQGPLRGAQIRVGTLFAHEASTDGDGQYTISDLPLGNYALRVSAFGHETGYFRVENPTARPISIFLCSKTGRLSGQVLTEAGYPIKEATVVAFTRSGGLYTREAQTDPNGDYAIFLAKTGIYTIIASGKGYFPKVDSNQGNGYAIDPNTSRVVPAIRLKAKPQGPKIILSSFEWDADIDPNRVDHHTTIMVDSNSSLTMIELTKDNEVGWLNGKDPNQIMIGDQIIQPAYQFEYSGYAGSSLSRVKLVVKAWDDQGGTSLTPYFFRIDSGVVKITNRSIGNTTELIIPAEGGQTPRMGLIDLDNDSRGDFYDLSFVNIPPCGIVSKQAEADADFAVSTLAIRLERLDNIKIEALTADYDVELLDETGYRLTDFEVNPKHPITIYLHFNPDTFHGNPANLVINYLNDQGEWVNDGIGQIWIEGQTIAFEVTHLSIFAAFEENTSPTNLIASMAAISQINLTWLDHSSNEIYFEIFRCVNADPAIPANYSLLATVEPEVTFYVDTNCSLGHTYYYQVRAVTLNGYYTDFSNQSWATINECDLPLTAPSNLIATAISEEAINLNWEDNSPCENGFLILRRAEGEDDFISISSTDPNITNYTDIGLLPEVTYYYQIKATSLVNDVLTYSESSQEAGATTLKAKAEEKEQGISAQNSLCFISYLKKPFRLSGMALLRAFVRASTSSKTP